MLSRILCLAGVGLACVLTPLRAAVPFNSILNVSYIYEDNITRDTVPADRLEEQKFVFSAGAEQPRVVNRDLLFSWGGAVTGMTHLRYDDLDFAQARVRAALRQRFGLGTAAPSLRVGVEAGPQWARLDGREGWQTAGSLAYSHRPLPWFRYQLSLERSLTWADADFFNQDATTALAHTTVYFADKWSLGNHLQYRRGDLLAFARPPAVWRNRSPYLQQVPMQPVTIFGDRFNAYTLRADSWTYGISLGRTLAERTSVAVAFDFSRTERDALSYINRFYTVTLTQQF